LLESHYCTNKASESVILNCISYKYIAMSKNSKLQ